MWIIGKGGEGWYLFFVNADELGNINYFIVLKTKMIWDSKFEQDIWDISLAGKLCFYFSTIKLSCIK
jgi:hypothetical protein